MKRKAFALENPKQALVPGVAAVSVKDQLEAAARKPLVGGDRPLGHDSLFGDTHLQNDLFRVVYSYRRPS